MDERDERDIFLNRKTDKTYIGSPFTTLDGRRLRIANKAFDGAGFEFAKVGDELVLRQTPAGRFEIKVTFIEADRSFQSGTTPNWSRKTPTAPAFGSPRRNCLAPSPKCRERLLPRSKTGGREKILRIATASRQARLSSLPSRDRS
jgi:hypothetical protein